MSETAIVFIAMVILIFVCPLLAAIYLHSGWYLLFWLMIGGVRYKQGKP